MPKITSTHPFSADVVLLGAIVEPGETVDVTDEQAAALLAQVGNWVPAKSTAKPAQPKE